MFNVHAENTRDFLERFHRFDHAVVRRAETCYGRTGKDLIVLLSMYDAEPKLTWFNVRMKFENIVESRLPENLSSKFTLSGGLTIVWETDRVWCAFALHESVQETIEAIRESDFHVCSQKLVWETLPYTE